jgi:ribosomal peptide maturation radical SAM protein 1
MTVFGGANCEGGMGTALMRRFPWIDVVVPEEGEDSLKDLCSAIAHSGTLSNVAGVSYREGGTVVGTSRRVAVRLDSNPAPDYEEYFGRLGESGLRRELSGQLAIPLKSSRGCWWAAKCPCAFCGLNHERLSYRTRSPETVREEVRKLSQRHRCSRLIMVDSVMPRDCATTLLRSLIDTGEERCLFYEIRATHTEADIRAAAAAGVRVVQPGVESLSTPILRLMHKGTTALQNIATLKWCCENRIQANWNIIIGTPQEPEGEYERMAALVPRLYHLDPPSLVMLALHRFSPYFHAPASYGIKVEAPAEYYGHVYGGPVSGLMDLARSFRFSYLDNRDPQIYSSRLRAAVDSWRRLAKREDGRLLYWMGPDFLLIEDGRTGEDRAQVVLRDIDARVYAACTSPASVAQVAWQLRRPGAASPDKALVSERLEALVEAGLMFAERGRYLALAVRARRTRNRRAEATRRTVPAEPSVEQ